MTTTIAAERAATNEKIIALRLAGNSTAQTAEACGVSEKRVWNVVCAAGKADPDLRTAIDAACAKHSLLDRTDEGAPIAPGMIALACTVSEDYRNFAVFWADGERASHAFSSPEHAWNWRRSNGVELTQAVPSGARWLAAHLRDNDPRSPWALRWWVERDALLSHIKSQRVRGEVERAHAITRGGVVYAEVGNAARLAIARLHNLRMLRMRSYWAME